ncbi:MAG: alanine--glyoxylate aminotransferase family protein [Nitrososphaerota archaeon]
MRGLLLIPGPTPLHPRVRQALGGDAIAHTSAEFREAFLELLDMTKRLFLSSKGRPVVFSGSGTVGLEALVTSLLRPGDEVLSLEAGYFGKRFTLLARLHGARVTAVEARGGRGFSAEELRELLARQRYRAVLMTHVETSRGVESPLPELVKACKEHGVLALVDGVCSVGACEFRFDDWGVDAAVTASQKGLAGPPGATLLMLSEEAAAYIEGRRDIPSYYLDLARWLKVMEDPRIYLSTPTTHVLLAVNVALKVALGEGLETRWRRHEMQARALQRALERMGLALVAEPGFRAHTVTAFYAPGGSAGELQGFLYERMGLYLAQGMGEEKEKLLRIGHFGNIGRREIYQAVSLLGQALRAKGHGVALEEALGGLLEELAAVPEPPA